MLISYKASNIHFYKFGDGNKILLCLHGYGLDGRSFDIIKEILSEEYTIIAFDFPYHGLTQWNSASTFLPIDIIEIVKKIIPINYSQKISILAYSMGGRVALQLLEDFPELIEQLVLLAPDGLHKNKWQWIATQTQTGNHLFKFTMKHPQWLFVLIQMINKFGLLNKSIVKFVHHYIDDEKERMLLYDRWTIMNKFKPNLKKLQTIIATNKIPVKMLFGKLDRIIVAKRGYAFQKNIPFIMVEEIHAGHQLLQPKHTAQIKALFNK